VSGGAHVVCFGNPLHGDDGFGLHVLRRLPAEVEAFVAGSAGLNALPYLESCAKAVLVDALRTGERIGSVHRLVPADLAPPGGEISLHDLGLTSLLAALPTVSCEIVIVGAEVGEIRPFAPGLSPPVRAAVPAAVRLVLREALGSASRWKYQDPGGVLL
jgi:hydrogenase maturation protease